MERRVVKDLIRKMNQIIIGKDETVTLAVIALLAGGHILIEDVPGVGKTTLAKSLAAVSGCDFKRIQFTPDTLPSDVTGVSVYQMNTGEFKYVPGSVMSQIILADEINRATEKTQASLLEAMGEHQVSVDGKTYELPNPFMVMATQNPIDELGTFTLPEAQLDRFMMKISIGYPKYNDELIMLSKMISGEKSEKIEPVISSEDIMELQKQVNKVFVQEDILSYMTKICELTRENNELMLGASPRALISWVKASMAAAFVDDRDYVIPDDVLKVMDPVLLHRIVLTADSRMNHMTAKKVMDSIRTKVAIPILKGTVNV